MISSLVSQQAAQVVVNSDLTVHAASHMDFILLMVVYQLLVPIGRNNSIEAIAAHAYIYVLSKIIRKIYLFVRTL